MVKYLEKKKGKKGEGFCADKACLGNVVYVGYWRAITEMRKNKHI